MSLQTAYDAYRAGRMDIAETRIAAELMRNPGSDAALHLGAMVASRRGDLRTALARIRASLKSPANGHEKLNVQGNILRALGSFVDAETSFQTALRADGSYDVARYNLAHLQMQGDKPREAAESFERLLASDPENRQAWSGWLHTLLESQQLDLAATAIEDARLSEPEKESARARLAFYRGDIDAGLQHARAAVSDPAEGAGAFALWLQMLHMAGRWEEAEDAIAGVLAEHPERADLWATAMRAYFRSGDVASALATYAAGPKEIATRLARGDIHISKGEYAEAEELAKAVLTQSQALPAAMHLLCLAALGGGKYDLAQQVADLGLQANPVDQFYYAVKATAGRAKGQDYRFYFDYDRFVRPYDLEPPEGWADMASFNADLAEALRGLHGFSAAPLDQTLKLGTQTAPDLRFVDSAPIKAFFQAVDPAVRAYLEEIGRDPRHAFLRRNIGGYRIRGAWSVRLGAGGHHIDHIHPEGWISSAYYVEVPEGEGKAGWIKFGEPPAPLNAALGQGPEHEVQPKPGRLVLFPSYLWHGTYPITGDTTRMTLPIDILPDKPPAP